MEDWSMPWHPFLVHFPIAAWLLGTLTLWAALLARKPRWAEHAWLLLALGALASIPAAVSGQAQFALQDRPELAALHNHARVGNLLPWLMVGLLAVKIHTLYRKPPIRVPAWIWCLAVSLLAMLILYAASLGGKLVFQSGIGIRRF